MILHFLSLECCWGFPMRNFHVVAIEFLETLLQLTEDDPHTESVIARHWQFATAGVASKVVESQLWGLWWRWHASTFSVGDQMGTFVVDGCSLVELLKNCREFWSVVIRGDLWLIWIGGITVSVKGSNFVSNSWLETWGFDIVGSRKRGFEFHFSESGDRNSQGLTF